MGFFSSLFNTMTNKWVRTKDYIEQIDCSGGGHKIRLIKENILKYDELRIYPAPHLLETLREEFNYGYIQMQFSANKIIFPYTYLLTFEGDYVLAKGDAINDFFRITNKYGAIQVGLNQIAAGLYNNKGLF